MSKLNFNSISADIFKVNANSNAVCREDIIGFGRLLLAEHSRNGIASLRAAKNDPTPVAPAQLTTMAYKELNEKFRDELFVYCARKASEAIGAPAPESFDEVKSQFMKFRGNTTFYAVLQGIFTEIIQPIIPAVYSEAVDRFADTVTVGFGETAHVVVGSNTIPVFEDSAWGALRSTPANYFYEKDYVLNPRPYTALIKAKWYQLLANDMDFGQWMANLSAGLYANTLGLWNKAMVAAAYDTTLVPTEFTNTFSTHNWVNLANKLAAQNNTSINNIVAIGDAVTLSTVLPTNSATEMDAALATLLGPEYIQNGYLGTFMGVRLMPIQDAMVPNTYNTVLTQGNIWLVASNAHKPMTIAYNRETPLTFEIDPMKSGDMEMGIQLTASMDHVAIFADKIGLISVT